MGIVSIGRSLLRPVPWCGLVLAVGAVAWISLRDVEATVQAVIGPDGKTMIDGGATIVAAVQAATVHVVLATLVGCGLALLLSAGSTYLAVTRPVRALTRAVGQMASGDFSFTIDGEARDDAWGDLARGLAGLRDAGSKAANDPAPVAQTAAEAKTAARSLMITQSVERFSQDFIASVQRLSAMTRRLRDAAEMMIAAAGHASDGSDKATTASSDAAGDVSSVATASEQLLDSIEEISRQVVQSTNVVKSAVERAVETNDGMGRLSSAAQKVGDVVSLISRIAAQTNLLALNATIEAARAGEAGRGFAVVAQEVKTLATQTAKATQDITGQIAEMQEATELSVEAIDKIQKKISEVEHISTIIAAAVHEQGAATQEIARNVRSAAAGTQSMSSHIENVVRSVGETSANASSVSNLARELDEIAEGMTDMVANFTRVIKVA